MSLELARQVARALTYEGYLLYPYRQSSLKNQKRWLFGTLYPPAYAELHGERSRLRAEVLLLGETAKVRVAVQCLRWQSRRQPGREPWLEASEHWLTYGPWSVSALLSNGRAESVALTETHTVEGEAELVALAVEGTLQISCEVSSAGSIRLAVTLANTGALLEPADPDEAQQKALVSAHLFLGVEGGAFVSLLEPEPEWQEQAARCKNDGVWPVLVGAPGSRDWMLASPIVVYDYPAIAPESRGDYYDLTEIDEMLALRVRTLTEAEKLEVRSTEARAAEMLERSERLEESALAELHGALRTPLAGFGDVAASPNPSDEIRAHPGPGDRVRLRPKGGRDVFDLALAGELATVVTVEEDMEGRRFCTVTVDADPGQDLGLSGQPGHRFFFELDELERVS